MYTKLKWENANGANPVTVKIYRSDTTIDRANLAALTPIATLNAGELEYNDTTVVRGQLYYYCFETSNTNDKVASPVYPIRAVPRRGPGSSQLLVGDYNYGYFGTLTSNQFINPIELRAALNFTGGSVGNTGTKWHKYARNGKILIIPENWISSGLSWKNLYDAGLVYGVDSAGFGNAGADVNQKRQVTIGPDTFWVRLMRGYNDDPAVFPPATTVGEPVETFTCEYDDLVYPLVSWCPLAQRMANVSALAPSTVVGNTVLVQEKTVSATSVNALTRGTGAGTRIGIATRAPAAYTAASYFWLPVLELIEIPAV